MHYMLLLVESRIKKNGLTVDILDSYADTCKHILCKYILDLSSLDPCSTWKEILKSEIKPDLQKLLSRWTFLSWNCSIVGVLEKMPFEIHACMFQLHAANRVRTKFFFFCVINNWRTEYYIMIGEESTNSLVSGLANIVK